MNVTIRVKVRDQHYDFWNDACGMSVGLFKGLVVISLFLSIFKYLHNKEGLLRITLINFDPS